MWRTRLLWSGRVQGSIEATWGLAHLEDRQQLQLGGRGHVGCADAVDGVARALHEHRQPAAHACCLLLALPGRPQRRQPARGLPAVQ